MPHALEDVSSEPTVHSKHYKNALRAPVSSAPGQWQPEPSTPSGAWGPRRVWAQGSQASWVAGFLTWIHGPC